MTTFRTRSDPGLVESALVLVAICIIMAGLLAYAGGLSGQSCAEACACGRAGR